MGEMAAKLWGWGGRVTGTRHERTAALPDLATHREHRLPSERRFGLTIAVALLAIALWPLVHGAPVRLWVLVGSIVLALLAIFVPKGLAEPNRLWFKLGVALGRIVSPIVAAVVFFGVLTPVAAVMRLTGRDTLRLKPDRTARTYWAEHPVTPTSMRNQF